MQRTLTGEDGRPHRRNEEDSNPWLVGASRRVSIVVVVCDERGRDGEADDGCQSLFAGEGLGCTMVRPRVTYNEGEERYVTDSDGAFSGLWQLG